MMLLKLVGVVVQIGEVRTAHNVKEDPDAPPVWGVMHETTHWVGAPVEVPFTLFTTQADCL